MEKPFWLFIIILFISAYVRLYHLAHSMKPNIIPLLLGIILFLGIFLRFYQLGTIPSGLTNDEADISYDAYSILLTGKDQWGSFLPASGFLGFGDFRPPLYTYLTLPFIKTLNLNELAVRIPSSLFGILSILFIYLYTKNIVSKRAGICAAFLMSVSPWAIGLSRVGIESNVAVTFVLVILFFLSLRKMTTRSFLICFFFSVVMLYTYTAYELFIPLFLVVLFLFYKKVILAGLKKLMIIAVVMLLLLLPLFLKGQSAAGVRFSQVGVISNINSIGFVNRLNDQIGACAKNYPRLLCKVALNKFVLFSSIVGQNYTSHFSFGFLYLYGTPTQFGILPQRGLLYVFEWVFFLIGVYSLIKMKKKEGYFLLSLLLISPIPDSLTGNGHYSRASIMLPFLVVVEGVGLGFFLEKTKSLGKTGTAFYLGYGAIFALSIFSFFITYVTYFRDFYDGYSQYGYRDLMTKIQSVKPSYDKIYVSRNLHDTKQYIYYLFYTKYDPRKYQNKKEVDYNRGADGWISINRIENIYFIENLPVLSLHLKDLKQRILLVADPSLFPKRMESEFVIKDRRNNIIFKAVDAEKLLKYNGEHIVITAGEKKGV